MELIIPVEKYLNSYKEAVQEFADNGVKEYSYMDYTKYDIFEKMENYRTGKNLPEYFVKSTYLWLIDNGEFIGEISIRHELTEPLLRFGGNIGYSIRYSQWNKGYGTKMLSLALEYAKLELNLQKVLITCKDTNIGSARVIEKNGGILQDKIVNIINGAERLTRRYWITL